MRIDMHVHAIGNGRDLTWVDDEVYFNADDNHQRVGSPPVGDPRDDA
jgi:hypothetical protein